MFTRKRAADIYLALKDRLENAEGLQVDDSPLDALIGAFAVELGEAWQAAQLIHDGLNPNAATGEALDHLLALVGLTRLPATRTTGQVNIDGAGVVGIGFLVKASDTNAVFRVVNGGALPGVFDVESMETGPITGTIDRAQTVQAGVGDVTQVGTLTTGTLEETDEEARQRRRSSLQARGRGTLGGIEAGLNAIPRVLAARVYEQFSPPAVRPWIYLPGHTNDDEDAIARVLYEHASGIGFTGTETKLVGGQYTVAWSWVQEVSVDVSATITAEAWFNDHAGLESKIHDYIEGLSVGEDVLPLQVFSLFAVPGVSDVVITFITGGGAINEMQIAKPGVINVA